MRKMWKKVTAHVHTYILGFMIHTKLIIIMNRIPNWEVEVEVEVEEEEEKNEH